MSKILLSDPNSIVMFPEFVEYMNREVVGQKRAISELVRSLNIASANMLEENSTITNLFFAGPTGVGKTESALAIVRWLRVQEIAEGIKYPDPPLIRVDGGISVSGLIGSESGLVGSR